MTMIVKRFALIINIFRISQTLSYLYYYSEFGIYIKTILIHRKLYTIRRGMFFKLNFLSMNVPSIASIDFVEQSRRARVVEQLVDGSIVAGSPP